MSTVAECLSRVTLAEPQVHEHLALYPLLAAGAIDVPGYRLLDETLEAGCARITEVSEAGSVPELKFLNECDAPVLLLDGEELVGAKQNRILNLTVLAPAHTTLVIPVSCVEAGRWHARSAEFSSAKRTHYASGRAKKLRAVSESLRVAQSRRSDQSEVWADIAEKSARMGSHSPTEAAEALYVNHEANLDEYLRAYSPVEGQSGALFAINGRPVGLDLFDSPRTLAGLLPKLVQSYALDAIDTQAEEGAGPQADEAAGLLQAAADARTERFPAIGEGEDLRLQGAGVAGGALVVDGRMVHLCVFRMHDEAGARRGAPLARASARRYARTR